MEDKMNWEAAKHNLKWDTWIGGSGAAIRDMGCTQEIEARTTNAQVAPMIKGPVK